MNARPRCLLQWLLAAGAGPLSAEPVLTLDLAAPPPEAHITRVYGRGLDGDGLQGVPVCGGHDCDGDGHADVAIAHFRGDPLGRPGAGEITVVFGDGTIGGSVDSAVVQAGVLRIAGAQSYEAAGAEIWIDDVTGDGLGDLLIGRQNYSLEFAPPEIPRIGAGGLTIVVGGPAWKLHAATLAYLDLADPPAGVQVVTLAGPSAYDRLGIWMRTGDIDGDRVSDILVGADEVDGAGQPLSHNQGAAFVVRGGSHLLEVPAVVDLARHGEADFPASLAGHVAWIDPPPNSANYHFGATVQVGDLDGNRRAEVLMAATLNRAGAGVRLPGAPFGTGSSIGGAPDGTVYIVWDENFPPTLWPPDHRFAVTDPPLGDYTAINGEAEAQSFGEELLAGHDYSGDGFADLMVGDLVADPLGRNNAGRGYVLYNAANLRGLDFDLDAPPPGVNWTRIDGPVPGAISSDTALHGDFDGDGLADLAIGNPHDNPGGRGDAGSVHILYGQPGGWPAAIDLAPAALPGPETMRLAHILGANGSSAGDRGDTLCYSAAAGDIDGDGRPDLIVNEMSGDAAGGSPVDVGNLLVIDAASLLAPYQSSLTFSSSGPLDFGAASVPGAPTVRDANVTNNSSGTVAIESLALAGPDAGAFSIQSDTGEEELNPGASRTVQVSFAPSRVGCFGAALVLSTDADAHPVAFALAGRGVEDDSVPAAHEFKLAGSHAVAVVESQIGTDYSLTRDADPGNPAPPRLFTVPGNGRTLFLTDPGAVDLFPRAFYRVLAERNEP